MHFNTELMAKEPTKEEMDEYLESLLNKFKQDSLFEIKQEFGIMLMRNIDDFTSAELERYNELKNMLEINN